jgi:(p)ppGpp synthase/HD superfamily hydrolase
MRKALEFAFKAHEGQHRKGGNIPYIVHILDVMKYLLYENAPKEVIIAGILHDVLEDTDYKKEDLNQFGEEVVKLIEFCSEPGNTVDATNMKETWKQRKEHSIKILKTATRNQALILLADKLSNITAIQEDLLVIGDELWDRFNANKEDIAWYYREILNNRDIVNDTRMYKLFKERVEEIFG